MIVSRTPENENDPATVGAVPGHGSTNPEKDTEMNEVTNTTAERPLSLRILDMQNLVDVTRSFNDAIFMAAFAVGDTEHISAIQTVSDEVSRRLNQLSASLDDVREALK